jgi:diguanylate cyclase (GGDEF)-like protein/PAS domain S-box-containing protein
MSTSEDAVVYKALLESTKAIPWQIEWPSLKFNYIGPQIESLLGWSQDSWKSIEDWATRIHDEDRDGAVSFCVAQSKLGVDHECDYRALHKDGHFVWIRDVIHVVRGANGEVESLVGFMFDISARKKTEEQLLALQKELHDLSFKDGLTGSANRRMFDTVVDAEWASARRTRHPLSVVLVDLDCFKQFNDHYGHLRGDDCLRTVAAALQRSATRPRDFVARYGGEEFVIVLPETDETGAKRVAERCRDAVLAEAIAHERSVCSSVVTVSIGVGTATPSADALEPRAFLEQVDARLYEAKRQGRNRLIGP